MKNETYNNLIKSVEALIEDEPNSIAGMSNVIAAIHSTFNFWWTGVYFVEPNANQLVLGPFQGPVACSRINLGKGVCGTAWQNAETIVVENVHEFEGHIACNSESNSEIVVPILHNNKVVAVLDIDSKEFATFNEVDGKHLEQICHLLSKKYWN